MFGFLWRNLKWVGLALVFAPLAVAGFGYWTALENNELRQDGVETIAAIEGGKRRTGRRSGSSYNLNLAWKDPAGQQQRAEGVYIPRHVADRIIVDNTLTVDRIAIRYLPNQPDRAPVLAETVGPATDPLQAALNGLRTSTPVALIGAILFWFLRRRERRVLDAATTPART